MKRLFAVLAVLAAGALTPRAARAEFIVGLTVGRQLVTFDSATPGATSAPVTITGLETGNNEFVVGIDYRPADGALVALTRQQSVTGGVGVVGRGRVYTLDLATGAATLINPLLTNAVGGAEVLLTDINGLSYGIDFNPVPNALRVVGSSDQNLRIVGGGAGATNVDTNLVGPGTANPNISAVAYSNNVAGASSTTLYAIDGALNLRTIGSLDFPSGPTPISPNTGQVLPVAPLSGVMMPSSNITGFDISGDTGVAYASFLTGPVFNSNSLYAINLTTGAATLLGTVGSAPFPTLVDITVRPAVAAVPEPASLALLGVGAAGLLGYARRRNRPAAA